MVSIRRRAAAHHTRLGGYEFAMVLVAQANGLGSNSATAGVEFLGKRCRKLCDDGIRPAGLAQVFSRFRQISWLLIAEGGQFDPEAVFDKLGVRDRQRVLGWQALMRPDGGLVA